MIRRFFGKFGKFVLTFLAFISIFFFVNRGGNSEVSRTSLAHLQNAFKTNLIRKAVLAPAKDFCVFDHKCRIPRVDPFSADVMAIFERPKFKECTDQPDIFNVRYDLHQKLYVLHVDMLLARNLMPNVLGVVCTYNEIRRGENDSRTWIGASVVFGQDWVIPRHIQGAIVQCYDSHNSSRALQRDAFSFVQYPVQRNEKRDEQLSLTHPSIVMLGIDSMSQMNFQRTMPLTAHFVRQQGWYEMLGYTKVGDNSLPNIMPLLTGLSSSQWRSQCDVHLPGCFDQFTYLWDHFRRAGYLTAYGEDTPSIDTFHYLAEGFKRQPVDFYLRTFLGALESLLPTEKHFGYRYCLGRRQTYRYVLDNCLQLVQRFVEETPKPLFGLFWSNAFSHDDFSGPASVDGDFVRYLEQFKKHGLFDKAIVFLFSDHGQRQGELMQLASSFMEERLPMLHIYLPPFYRRKYPKMARALDMNRHRLSSTMDLHLTLVQLFQQAQTEAAPKMNSSCALCQSLLEPIPANRSCEDAGIPDHWCTCEAYEQVEIDKALHHWTKLVIHRINKYLFKHNLSRKCLSLKLANLLRAERKLAFNDDGKALLTKTTKGTYRIKFITQPNLAVFRASFQVNELGEVRVQEEFITRLNAYREESFCVHERVAKKFCACLQARQGFSHFIDIDANYQGTPS